jgi:AAA domain
MSTPIIQPTQSLASVFGAVESTALTQEDRLKIAIVGEPGVGKSWLAATAPGPNLFFDFDDRAESLAGKQGIIIRRKPSMIDVETVLSNMKARKNQKLENPKTVTFDSVTYMQRAMEDEIFRQAPDLSRTIKVGPSLGMKLRKGWDTINGIQRYLEYLIAEFSALANVIFIFHEKAEKDAAKSQPDKPAYTGDITIDPQYLANTLSLLNERFRIKQDYNGKYQVQCRYTGAQDKFNAITTMLLDPVEPANLMSMIAKHQAARAKQQGVVK